MEMTASDLIALAVNVAQNGCSLDASEETTAFREMLAEV
jgi:hypothetical protein